MKIEIAKHGRMTESGSSLLRLIQNQDMPLLDLLVREAVQNSLDAKGIGKTFVKVDISIKKFFSVDLNKHLEGITDKLNARFPITQGKYKSIVIRDFNTVGLTGPVKYDEVKGQNFGNCLKLIYEISKPQTNEGAGGSWGLGKTIYFRVGIGLVLYYSRIKVDGKYKSRMAACFVEDETRQDSMLPSLSGVKRGIAWWGESLGQDDTVPIENENEIKKILSVFGISPYIDQDTGTTVIIPYIDEKALLQEVYPKNEDQENKPSWVDNISDYLKVAFQRWYAPRISNDKFDGAYLTPSVNNEIIKVTNLIPLFKVVRELYICSTKGKDKLPEDSFIANSKVECNVDEIRVRDVFIRGTSSAGKFAYLKLEQSHLKMLAPDNEKSPYQHITNRAYIMDNGNPPIVMFTRKPGMIVGYDFEGMWTHRMPHSASTEYIIGLFVANSENRMKDIFSKDGENLPFEEYIRKSEKADHASWSDMNIDGTNPRVIYKIQNNIIRTILDKYKEKTQDVIERTNVSLSRFLANILLPSTGFGREASDSGNGRGERVGGSGASRKHSSINLIGQPEFSDDGVSIRFELNMVPENVVINLLVVTDYKKIGPNEWESDDSIGRAFPLYISNISFSEKKDRTRNAQWHLIESDGEDLDIEVSYGQSSRFGTQSSLTVRCNKSCYLRGTLVFGSYEKGIQGTIDVSEEKK